MGSAVTRHRINRVLVHLLLYLVTASLMFPLFWMIMTSFKPSTEWTAYPPAWIPKKPTLSNYRFILLGNVGYSGIYPSSAIPYLNTVLVASTSTVIALAVGLLGAYSLSRFSIKRTGTLISIMMPRMFPPLAMIIPLMIFFQLIHAIDTYWGLIIVYTGFTLPYSVLMLKGFMDGVPKEFTEAAMLDGLSEWEILYKIWLPAIRNGLMTTGLFVLILNWTEYAFAVTLSSRGVETITLALGKLFSNEAGTFYGPQSALGILAAIPTVLIGILIHKNLAYGFTFGALKR